MKKLVLASLVLLLFAVPGHWLDSSKAYASDVQAVASGSYQEVVYVRAGLFGGRLRQCVINRHAPSPPPAPPDVRQDKPAPVIVPIIAAKKEDAPVPTWPLPVGGSLLAAVIAGVGCFMRRVASFD